MNRSVFGWLTIGCSGDACTMHSHARHPLENRTMGSPSGPVSWKKVKAVVIAGKGHHACWGRVWIRWLADGGLQSIQGIVPIISAPRVFPFSEQPGLHHGLLYLRGSNRLTT